MFGQSIPENALEEDDNIMAHDENHLHFDDTLWSVSALNFVWCMLDLCSCSFRAFFSHDSFGLAFFSTTSLGLKMPANFGIRWMFIDFVFTKGAPCSMLCASCAVCTRYARIRSSCHHWNCWQRLECQDYSRIAGNRWETIQFLQSLQSSMENRYWARHSSRITKKLPKATNAHTQINPSWRHFFYLSLPVQSDLTMLSGRIAHEILIRVDLRRIHIIVFK